MEKMEKRKLIYVEPSTAVYRVEGGALMIGGSNETPEHGGDLSKGFNLIEEDNRGSHNSNIWNNDEEE